MPDIAAYSIQVTKKITIFIYPQIAHDSNSWAIMVYKAGDTPITEQWVQTQNEPKKVSNDNLQAD
ncbi:MAG: hypothetical protein IPL33_17605 [Sphingobacteriales bacterium]|nr:hypothetical protein [Sphingobacteriales bacterium]